MLCAHPWQVLEHPSLCLWRVGRARGAVARARHLIDRMASPSRSVQVSPPPGRLDRIGGKCCP